MAIRSACAAALLFTAGLTVVACGSGTTAGTGAISSSEQAAVEVDTFMFSPGVVHVRVGDTVTWTNHDDILHTVTAGTREYQPGDSGRVIATRKDGMFDLQLDGKGAVVRHTFTRAGTVHYFCDRHPGMEADVVVS